MLAAIGGVGALVVPTLVQQISDFADALPGYVRDLTAGNGPFGFLALGLLVAILDLIPLAGATLGAIIVTLVALTDSATAAAVVAAFFIVYQQLENHLLQPIVYGRTVRLSPLAILLSVLIGVEVAGIVGALLAIPVGGTINILLEHWRRRRGIGGDPSEEEPPEEPPDEQPGPEREPPPRRRRRLTPGALR